MSARLDEILETLRGLVRFDVRTLFDEHGALLPPKSWPAEGVMAVSSLTSRELFVGAGKDRALIGVQHTVKLSDRVRALELALRELGTLAPDCAPLPETLEEMTDKQIIRIIVDARDTGAALKAAGSTLDWLDDATAPKAIDEDFRRITAAYDLLRPNVRLWPVSEKPWRRRQRMLPPPVADDVTLPADTAPATLLEAVEPDPEPDLLPRPNPPRDGRLSYEEQERRGINIASHVGWPLTIAYSRR